MHNLKSKSLSFDAVRPSRLHALLVPLLLCLFWISACANEAPTPVPATATVAALPTNTPTLPPTTIPTETPTAVPPATLTPAPTETPVPPTSTPEPTPTTEPQAAMVEVADCAFPNPFRQRIRCGYLVVPEYRNQADSGNTIRLHFAIFESDSPNPWPDPVVYLHGGPGGHILNQIPFGVSEQFEQILAERELIVFDQRGVGYSEPELGCPELTYLFYETLNRPLTSVQRITLQVETRRLCYERLLSEGVDVAAYTTPANAADVEDLRQALGYDQWNIYGISYGTRLALTVMRDFPEGIRSVTLDSAAPLEVDFFAELAPNAERAFDLLFAGCAADANCGATYPDLETTYYDLVEALAQNPIEIEVRHIFLDETFTVSFDDDDAIGLIFDSLYSTSVIPRLPRLIQATADGDYEILAEELEISLIESLFLSEGVLFSIWCSEEIPFSSYETVNQASRDVEVTIRNHFNTNSRAFFSMCENWQTNPAAAIEDEPIISDIPTLILSGEYDPITPPAWGQRVADSLSNDYFYQFPGVGHGVMGASDCGSQVVTDFIAAPDTEPDAQCIEQLTIEFELP